MTERSRGVYFLANDPYIEWVIALLESVRAWNPTLPICCIPFDDRSTRLADLATRYGFSVLDDPTLARLDGIGRRLRPSSGGDGLPPGVFRKLATFWGPFDEFVFLDADVIVTCDLGPILDTLDATGSDLTYMHGAPFSAVYAPGSQLRERGGSTAWTEGITTGVWAARRGLMSEADVDAFATAIEPYRDEILYSDQTFISHYFESHLIPVAAFEQAHRVGGLSGGYLAGGIVWNKPFGLNRDGGRPVLHIPYLDTDVLITHWAGVKLNPQMPYRRIWRLYRWPGSGLDQRLRRWTDAAASGPMAARRWAGRLRRRRRGWDKGGYDAHGPGSVASSVRG